ncbi:hypothetical protein [Streptomyces sp. BK79]|uniref:hypothetical protein n=1 Tax=Streptomyces sp. BK79 TaxID=3350097 RepID=UPI0037705998
MTSWERDAGGPGPVGRQRAVAGPRAPGGTEREPRRTHVSAAGLRARGWTVEMVRRLLGEPDLLRSHPYVRAAPPTRLYAVERVEAVERGAAFRAASAAAARRSLAVRTSARRRRRELRARITERSGDWWGGEGRGGGLRGGELRGGGLRGNSGAAGGRGTEDREVDRSPPQEPS